MSFGTHFIILGGRRHYVSNTPLDKVNVVQKVGLFFGYQERTLTRLYHSDFVGCSNQLHNLGPRFHICTAALCSFIEHFVYLSLQVCSVAMRFE